MSSAYPHSQHLDAIHAGPIRTPQDSIEWLDYATEDKTRRGVIMDLDRQVLNKLRALHTRIKHGKFDSEFWFRIHEIGELDFALNEYENGTGNGSIIGSMILGSLFPLLDQITRTQPERRLPLANLYYRTSATYDWYYHHLLTTSPEYLQLLQEIDELNKLDWGTARARIKQLCPKASDQCIEALKPPQWASHPPLEPLYPPPELNLVSFLQEYLSEDYSDAAEGYPNYQLSRRLRQTPRRGCSTLCPECNLYVQGLYQGKRMCYHCWVPS